MKELKRQIVQMSMEPITWDEKETCLMIWVTLLDMTEEVWKARVLIN